jgi:PAS domain S-box-containing protein
VAGRSEAVVLRSAPSTRTEGWSYLRPVLAALAMGLAYYGGSLVGFTLRLPASGISFFWPPTAILTAALLVQGSHWQSLLIGAFIAHAAAHAQDGVPTFAWITQFLGNAFQAALASLLVLRHSRISPFLADARSVFIFVTAVCITAPVVASLIPAAVYVRLGWAPDFVDAWWARAVTNSVASITLVPPLVVAGQFLLSKPLKVPARTWEFVLLLVGITVALTATSAFGRGDVLGLSTALYAPTPFLLWAIVRSGIPGLSIALLWTTILTFSIASAGQGPLIGEATANTVLGVQVFVGGNALLMLLIGSLFEEHRSEHARLVDAGTQNVAILNHLREQQQRYALATSAGGVGVWDFNIQTGRVYLEGPLKTLLGYGDDEIGNHLGDMLALIWPADRGDVQTRLTDFSTGAIDSFDIEFRMCHRDGSVRWIVSKGAITDRSGGVATRIRGTYTDVTERKESDRALRDASDALARTWRISAMSELSASLAHELNQPLTAIVTNVNTCVRWLDSGTPTTDLREALSDVLRDSRRASQIVERTRGLFAKSPVQQVSVNLNAVIRDIVEVAQIRLRESHIVVELRLANDVGSVVADPVQMQQVVLNLIMNAAEAMRDTPADSRAIRISTRQCRDMVFVSVRDTGKGFAQDERSRVFDPFYTTKVGGTGMGLAICRSIVLNHGGSLTALTNRGDGATFRIKMPTADELPLAVDEVRHRSHTE